MEIDVVGLDVDFDVDNDDIDVDVDVVEGAVVDVVTGDVLETPLILGLEGLETPNESVLATGNPLKLPLLTRVLTLVEALLDDGVVLKMLSEAPVNPYEGLIARPCDCETVESICNPFDSAFVKSSPRFNTVKNIGTGRPLILVKPAFLGTKMSPGAAVISDSLVANPTGLNLPVCSN